MEFVHKVKYHKYYKIKFIETGYETIQCYSNISKGLIKDYFKPTIYGVGYRGNKEVSSKLDNLLYDRWYSILSRNYNMNDSHYNGYGGKGHRVSDDWLNFTNFYYDVILIEGYEEDKFLNKEIELDKDFKQDGIESKIYSKETCIWIDKTKNHKKQSSKQKKFEAISPNNNIYYHDNIREFGRIHNICNNTIRYSLKNKTKTKNGWTFKYCDN